MMRPLMNLSLCLLLALGLSACGGGGGGGSTAQNPVGSGSSGSTSSGSSGSSSSTTTYSYDRVATDFIYDDKIWDSVTIGRFVGGGQTYLTDYSDDAVTIVHSKTNSIDLDITGTKRFNETPVEHSWSLTNDNATITTVYDPTNPSSTQGAVATQSFANVTVDLLTYYTDYLATIGILYTDIGIAEITWRDGSRKDTFVVAYGDATESGDLPTSGTKQYNIDPDIVITNWTNNGSTTDRVLAGGEGQLSINFTNGAVTGSIEMSEYYDWDLWSIGGTNISQVFGYDRITMDLVNGSVSNGNITASVTINHEGSNGTSTVGVGNLQGMLFGPDGDEIAVSFYMFEDVNNDTQDLYAWDLFGGAIGQ